MFVVFVNVYVVGIYVFYLIVVVVGDFSSGKVGEDFYVNGFGLSG